MGRERRSVGFGGRGEGEGAKGTVRRPSWRRWSRRGQQGPWGTHDKQGTAPVVARAAQVSPRLPPGLKAFKVCSGRQPGRGSRGRAVRAPGPVTQPAPHSTPAPARGSRARVRDPLGADQWPGVWVHPAGVTMTQVKDTHTRTHTSHKRAHARTHTPQGVPHAGFVFHNTALPGRGRQRQEGSLPQEMWAWT